MTRSALTLLLRGPAILGLVLCVAAPLAQARPVPVYMVDVAGETPAALQDGMRQVLVRSTGHRDAASDPALAALVSSAGNYVKSYGKGQVTFDGPSIERAIRAAGLEVWPADRPVTMVTFTPGVAREDLVRAELEKQAARRGLPITVVPAASADPSGKDLAGDALLQTAKRYGAEAVLVGRQEAGQWRWTLYNPRPHPAFSGAVGAGIDGTADLLAGSSGDAVAGGAGGAGAGAAAGIVPTANTSAAAAAAAAAGPETLARIQVQGVSDLEDYATVERMLESVPGVRRARMAEAQGTQAIFEVAVRGGADALDRGLAGQARLARAGASGGNLVYLYRP